MIGRFAFAAALCVFATSGSAHAVEGVELRWGFEKGRSWSYKVHENSTVSFDLPDLSGFGGPKAGPARAIAELELHPEIEISSVKPGKDATASAKGKYAAARCNVEVPARGGIGCDTESEADRQEAATDPFKRNFLMLKGKVPFSFAWGSAAGVSKMAGHARFVPAAFNPKITKDAMSAAACSVCAELLKDQAVEDLFADVFIPLPPGKTLAGDKWKGESSALIYPIGVFVLKTEYVLKEVKDGKVAVISCTSAVTKKPKSEMDFGVPAKDDPLLGFTRQVLEKLQLQSSSRTGEFEFDLEKKELVKGSATLEVVMTGKFDSPVGGSYDFTFKAAQTRTIERKP